MTASIFWQHNKPRTGKEISSMDPSKFIEAMEEVYGREPWNLTRDDYAVIKGMAAAGIEEARALRKTLEDLEPGYEIVVWVER